MIVMKHMFRPADSQKVSDGIGKAGAGYIGNEIARVISERVNEKEQTR